ncbi:MAG: laccase domain-containing protein [Planctomycetota bacterium]
MYTLIGLWPPHPGLERFRVAWTDRLGGVSTGPFASLNLSLAVGDERRRGILNRRRVCVALGLPPTNTVWCDQNGDGKVRVVQPSDLGRGLTDAAEAIPNCDGMIAALADFAPEQPGGVRDSFGLALLAADDLMLALVDPVAGVGGVFHFGWRDCLAGGPDLAVEALLARGANPAALRGFAAPHACSDRLEVPDDLRLQCKEKYGLWTDMLFRPAGSRKVLFDLQGLVVARLTAAGMPPAHLISSLECTISRTDLLFSESHARKAGHSTGRQGLFLVFDPA